MPVAFAVIPVVILAAAVLAPAIVVPIGTVVVVIAEIFPAIVVVLPVVIVTAIRTPLVVYASATVVVGESRPAEQAQSEHCTADFG